MTKEKEIFDKKVFLKILGIVFLFSMFLFPYNYCSDIYNVIDSGYWEYAKEWFAPAGRTIGMGVLFLFEIINIPVNLYIFIMKVLSIFIATYSIYVFYNIVLRVMKYDEETQKDKRKYILIATMITFLNMASHQYFYYAESAIMWLGVLFTVLAVNMVLKDDDKFKYLKTIILLFIAMNCYQATILFFIPATILFLGIKKEKLRSIFFEIIKLIIIVGICLIIGYFILQGLTKYFEIVPYRNNSILFDKENSLEVLQYLVLQNHNETDCDLIYLIVNAISILSIIILKSKFINKRKSITLITILLIIISAFMQTWILVSVVDYYMADRIQFGYLATVGMCALFFIMYTNVLENKKLMKIFYEVLILFLMYMIIEANYISILNKYVRIMDDYEGNTISEAVKEYEKENNCEVTKIVYCYDNYVKYDCVNVKKYGDPTFRIFASPWVCESALRYYVGKDLEIYQTQDVFEDIFWCRNWDKFNEKQIVIEGNTLYFCVY